jgi:hypothetical protein
MAPRILPLLLGCCLLAACGDDTASSATTGSGGSGSGGAAGTGGDSSGTSGGTSGDGGGATSATTSGSGTTSTASGGVDCVGDADGELTPLYGFHYMAVSLELGPSTPVMFTFVADVVRVDGAPYLSARVIALSTPFRDLESPLTSNGGDVVNTQVPLGDDGSFELVMPATDFFPAVNPFADEAMTLELTLRGKACAAQSPVMICGSVEGRVHAPIDFQLQPSLNSFGLIINPDDTDPLTVPMDCAGTQSDPIQ